MLGDLGLDKNGALFRRQSGTEPVDEDLAHIFTHGSGIFVVAGKGMPIGHEKETIILILHLYPVLKGS